MDWVNLFERMGFDAITLESGGELVANCKFLWK